MEIQMLPIEVALQSQDGSLGRKDLVHLYELSSLVSSNKSKTQAFEQLRLT